MASDFNQELLRRWVAAGVEILRDHRTELNALNVFPVPDGDTGTNLYLTFKAAADALSETTNTSSLAQDFAALAKGARMGARGNSGVILASVFQAMAIASANNARISLIELLQAGSVAARSSVIKPVEGTALTVLEAAAASPRTSPEQIASTARAALSQTPQLLPELKAAGVVDAGGRGVVLLLDALVATFNNSVPISPAVGFVPKQTPQRVQCEPDAAFELMFIVSQSDFAIIEPALQTHASSLIVTKGVSDVQVHLHLNQPADFLNQFSKTVNFADIQIESLQYQRTAIRLVAQIFGPTLGQELSGNGVQVVFGEPDLRPSVQDFVAAGLKAESQDVILLPSDPDSIRVVEIAVQELKKLGISASVIPTTTLMQTLAAIAVFDSAASLAANLQNLETAVAHVCSLAITRADRNSQTAAGKVQLGEFLVLENLQLKGHATDLMSAMANVECDFAAAELITVLIGEAASESESFIDWLQQKSPNAEIQKVAAGQRIWHYLIGVE